MNTHRSSYEQTIKVLKEIAAEVPPNEIKAKLYLSRYSFNYTVSRLIQNELVEYKDKQLVLSRKGYNILRFEKEYPDGISDEHNLQVVDELYNLVS